MIWLRMEDIILLHSGLIEKTGGLDGLRDRDALEAALLAWIQAHLS